MIGLLSTWRKVVAAAPILAALSTYALDDLLVYSDAGCEKGSIEQSFAQASGGSMRVGTGQRVPVICTDKHRGTDAIELNLASDLAVGGYYDFILKFPDWGQKDLKNYRDVRFFVKNLLPESAHVVARWENGAYQSSPKHALNLPPSDDWYEIVIPLTVYGAFMQSSLMNGFGFSQPATLAGSRLHLLIDDIRVTDGSGQGALELPAGPGGAPPKSWPAYMLAGSYDSYEDSAKSVQLAGQVEYRYQYLTTGWKTYSQGRFIEKFIATGKALGARSAFTWYQVAKAGEGGPTVKGNLNLAAFMKAYFDDYDLALNQIAAAQAEAPILILEPDMYGFLLQGGLVPDMDASQCQVEMGPAKTLSGRDWPNHLKGFAEYMVQRAKEKVPGILVGHLINSWGVLIPGEIGQGSMDAHLTSAAALARFVNSLGEQGRGDMIFVEKADRDAGTKGSKWSWGSAEYQRYFAWTKTLSYRTGLRICGWQISQGLSTSPLANRDDAVERFRDHPQEWTDAGFIGVLFGPGMAGQADYVQDGGAFVKAVQAYRAKPQPLPAGLTTTLRKTPPSVRRASALEKPRPGRPRMAGAMTFADFFIRTRVEASAQTWQQAPVDALGRR